jgi:putative transposase
VNHLKGVSSRMLRKGFPELAARGAQLWTPSYFVASTGGAPIERLRKYVEAQEKPSQRKGFVSQNSH